MRTPRIRIEGEACYHVMSRIVDGRMRLGPGEKDRFQALMRDCEAFCGVRVRTHAVMDNHFHILLETPGSGEEIPEEEVVRRMVALYGPAEVRERAARWEAWREEGLDDLAEAELEALRARMGDLPAFMKTLKQRFSQWYNRTHDRRGTLWEDRYKSVVVENGRAFAVVAAYIEHNPVRAGLVGRPEEYRWCGRWDPEVATEAGVPAVEPPDDPPADLAAVLAAGGKLGLDELLECRVRYFSDGLAFGSRAFVDEVFRLHRRHFGSRRTDGARPMRQVDLDGLFTARDLRKAPVIPSPGARPAAVAA